MLFQMRNKTMIDQPLREASTFEGFHSFVDDAGEAYGSFEVFWHCASEENPMPKGWYWWYRHYGHPPMGTPMGPYTTSKDAYRAARRD